LLIASKSKTSLDILIVCLAALPVLIGLLRLGGRVLGAVAAGVGLCVAGALFGWLAWCTAQGLDPLEPIEGVTFTRRTEVWAFVVGEIAKRPLGGAGFGSFWDIDPQVQPSLKSGLWFSKADAFTNEAHNGYLDLLATTGFVGLFGALYVLLRWVWRGLARLREILLSPDPDDRWGVPAALSLGVFPFILFVHNFTESSYFTANAIFGALILVVGADIDLRYGLPDDDLSP
jgi:O-antigen ligase